MKYLSIFLFATAIGGCTLNAPLGDCRALEPSTWAQGPPKPEVAEQARLILKENGIGAEVQVRNYGEINSCDEFTEIGLDLSVTFDDAAPRIEMDKSDRSKNVYQILDEVLDLQLRSVLFRFPDGGTLLLDGGVDDRPDRESLALPVWPSLSAEQINKRVYVLVYDPILASGEKLTAFKGWNDYRELASDTIAFFKEISGNRINYSIAFTREVDDVWLEKNDGFRYTEETYLDVIDRGVPRHDPDIADYAQFLEKAEYDICGKLNRGEIDELWLFGGPWFGFYESRLAGPLGFRYNSEPYPGTTCNKLLPIMGFSYERSVAQMLESFGHRTEATMETVYESYEQIRFPNSWELFSLTALQSISVDYSGCGNVHFPPNAIAEYVYTNRSSANSICDDFFYYPALSEPSIARQPTDCTSWGCSTFGFFTYWFRHIPAYSGVGLDGKSNDWWQYIINPNLVQNPFSLLVATTPIQNAAKFSFRFNGSSSGFYVDVSTSANMSAAVRVRFAEGAGSPLINRDPTKWDKYSPGEILYWRVTSISGIQSAVQRAIVADDSSL